MTTIDAAANPAQAQQMINEVMNMVQSKPEAPEEPIEVPDVTPPLPPVVTLPGGYVTFAGEVTYEAEVRELNGRDEEALSRIAAPERLLQDVLMRGTVRVGGEPVSEEILNNLLAGDRDYLLLRVFMATFGPTLEIAPYCPTCGDRKQVELNLDKDVPVRRLSSPADRVFTVRISKGTVKVELPTGHTQKEMIASADKNVAELSTLLLSNTVTEVNGATVISAAQVLDLPIRDRRKISEEILARNPGPLLAETTCKCPKCDSTLEVPLSLAALFRF